MRVLNGTAGAALPFAGVLLVNLSSFHQAYATSEADGSFDARIFAPPGPAVMIRHGPPRPLWRSLPYDQHGGIHPKAWTGYAQRGVDNPTLGLARVYLLVVLRNHP